MANIIILGGGGVYACVFVICFGISSIDPTERIII